MPSSTGTDGPSPHDIEHMDDIIHRDYGDWFSAHLLRLIHKADLGNRELLRKVYPKHVEVYEFWYHGPKTLT